MLGYSKVVDVKQIDKIMMTTLDQINGAAIDYTLTVLSFGDFKAVAIAAAEAAILRSGAGGEVLPMRIVRLLPTGTDSLNELKALTFETGSSTPSCVSRVASERW